MPDEGSVWDTGPQYPEIWPGPTGDPEPVDTTPQSLSPVDIDAPAAPVAPVPAPEPPARPEPPWWRRRVIGLAVWIWLLVAAAILALLVLVLVTDGADDPELTEVTTLTPAPTPPPTPAVTLPVATTAAPTVPPQTVPPVTAPPTAPPTVPDTAPATTAPQTAPPTAPPPTAPVPTTAAPTLPPDGPVVTINGSVGPCNFGSECLIAGFTIQNFDTQPTEFVCEFSDGSRYTFRFDSQGVERACSTGDPTDSITIEVAGVRSETFTRP